MAHSWLFSPSCAVTVSITLSMAAWALVKSFVLLLQFEIRIRVFVALTEYPNLVLSL
jgi:hypothetical protein